MSITVTTDNLVAELAQLMTICGFPTTGEDVGAHLEEPFERWELDSLGRLELAVALGQRYGITVTDADAETLRTPVATIEFVLEAVRRRIEQGR
jgi:acyl carrier protein